MASRFVLTAQVQLQAPTNTRQVVNQIQQQLQGINVPINVQGGQQAAKQVNNITKATKQATTQAQKMGKAFGTSIRRFSAFSIASRGISLLTSGLANATNEAIAFEREMIKISQVTGKTMGQLKGLENTITDLATSFGVSSKSILSVGRILAQAGIQANDLTVALTALAKTELSPTFEDITKTAEGAVAILAQFGEGVGALERQLGAISRVAGQFAVESGDLISVIRRTGGVFKAAGGDLEELIALFTSVRATTRESAESIATGLRTIFTRIQRPKTIEFLKQFGVELTDLSGKFVGPYEAVRRLSEVLSGLQEGDIQFVRIAEELGGFRQIGKVIPLLQQFEVAEKARQAALEGGTALDDDATKAQKALAVQISKVKEEFQALIRTVVQSSAFQVFVKTALELSSAFIKISETLTPLLPLLATVAAFKFARGAAGFARGIGAGIRGTKGFNSGGIVPGTGNRDTVPAMLTPGEFVIRKSSVAKIGAGNLAAMNAKGYNTGGPVTGYESSRPYVKRDKETYFKDKDSPFLREPAGKKYANKFNADDKVYFTVESLELNPNDFKNKAPQEYKDYINAKDARVRGIFFEKLLKAAGVIEGATTSKGKDATSSRLDGIYKGVLAEVKSRKDTVSDTEIGNKIIGGAIDPKSANVDSKLAEILAEKTLTNAANTINFGQVYLLEDALAKEGAQNTSKKTTNKTVPTGKKKSPKRSFAGGGISGSDTVPAMLTPGEFVVSKKAAQSIGYSNLSRMNTQGVQGFAKGGAVGVQYFQNGTAGSGVSSLVPLDAEIVTTGDELLQNTTALIDLTAEIRNLVDLLKNLAAAVQSVDASSQGSSSTELSTQTSSDSSSRSNRLPPPEALIGLPAPDPERERAKQVQIRNEAVAQRRGVDTQLAEEQSIQDASSKAMKDAEAKRQQALAFAEQYESGSEAVVGQTKLSQGRTNPASKSNEQNKARAEAAKKQAALFEKMIEDEMEANEESKARTTALNEARKKYTDTILAAQAELDKTKGPKKGPKPVDKVKPTPDEPLKLQESKLPSKSKIQAQALKDTGQLAKPKTPKNVCDTCAYLDRIHKDMKDGFKLLIEDFRNFGNASVKDQRTFGKNFNKYAQADLKKQPQQNTVIQAAEVVEEKGDKEKGNEAEQQSAAENRLQTFFLAAGAMSAFIPQIEGATEGFGAVTNALPGAIAGFGAFQAAAASLPTFEIEKDDQGNVTDDFPTFKKVGNALSAVGKSALQTASVTIAATKLIDAYSGVHAKAEEAVKAASEANDEASIVSAEKAAVESANAETMNKVSAGVSAAFGAAASVADKIPGPWGKVIGTALRITGVLASVAIKFKGFQDFLGISADQLTNFFAVLGQGPTIGQIKANTRYTIEAARTQRELAAASEQAAEELKKIQSGELSATESLGSEGAAARTARSLNKRNAASAALAEANTKQNQAFDRIQQSFDSQGTFGGALLGAGFSFLTGGQRDRNNQQNEQLRKEAIAGGEQALADLQPRLAAATTEQVTAATAAGGTVTFDKFLDSLDDDIVALARQTDQLNGNTDQMDKLKKNFENQSKAVLENIKFIKAMNFGLSAVTSGIDAYGASLNNLIASQESGFSTAAAAATTLGTAITSAGANISSDQLNQSLDLLGDNLRNFGANEGQVDEARDLISGLNTVQKGAADALAAVKEGFKGGSVDPVAIQKQLKSAILSAVPDDSPIRQRLIDAFPDEIPPEVVSNFLNTGDVSGILDQAFGPVSEQVQKQLIEPLNKMAEQERALIALAQQRRAAEQKLIEVQKRAIDTQIEAAKNLEFFGGAKFTPEKEFAARRDQANLVLQDAGISGLTTGSADDIRRASSQIMSQFSSQQAAQNSAAIAGTGAFGGVQGVEDDRRAELKAANIELAEITKRGIEQRKQELELIQKKNQAEKDALNSLLGGDVEAFFEKSSAAAAGTALRSGNAAAASLFSASSLGKGLQGLQGTGLSDAENRRASQLTFGAFGLGDRAASIFSGTTTEEQRIKAEGRELSQLQSELGDQAVDLEQMTVDAKTVVITAANMEMQRISDEVTRTQNIGVDYNSRGGVIYANRGMFVPRGTDTVPAMLTPGEFVVNRAAVNRGNNLQILRAMNGGMGSGATNAAGTPTMNRGGLFGRRESPSFEMPDFSSVFDKFSEAVDKLAGLNISVKLDTTNVNVNFNGTSFLSTLDDKIRTAVISEVSNQTSKLAFNETGNIKTGGSVLGDIG